MPRRRLNRWPLPRPYLAAVPGAVLTAALALLLPMAPAPAWSETNKAEARDGFVTLTPQAALPLALGGRQLVQVTFPAAPTLPVLGADQSAAAHRLLRRLYATGQAAGHHGDLYDNRDRGHARLDPLSFPQLTHIRYGGDFRDGALDYGLARRLQFDAPVIGNSSTALTRGALWRSQPRMALTSQGGAPVQDLYRNYRSGQIHVYPEHRDHDPEYGDLFPANTPYYLIAQGSSGADLPHLEALAMILAALRPDTKARAMETGLLAPLVQMIYRRSLGPVRGRDDYLSGLAHPSAFRAGDLRLARLVTLANAIAPDEIPPVVQLQVLHETPAHEGVDFFGTRASEVLFDTPSAIARIWRTRAGQREMVVSAEATQDPNDRDLTFDWVLLRGDPEQVQITPLDDGRQARITLGWQEPRPVPGAPQLSSARVDIGVFANNGLYDSAPAFISVLLPGHEQRRYDADMPKRPISITRQARSEDYTDPLIFPAMDWRDVYLYDDTGTSTGWIRHRGESQSLFDAQGRRLSATDGTPTQLHYPIRTIQGGRREVIEHPQP